MKLKLDKKQKQYRSMFHWLSFSRGIPYYRDWCTSHMARIGMVRFERYRPQKGRKADANLDW